MPLFFYIFVSFLVSKMCFVSFLFEKLIFLEGRKMAKMVKNGILCQKK